MQIYNENLIIFNKYMSNSTIASQKLAGLASANPLVSFLKGSIKVNDVVNYELNVYGTFDYNTNHRITTLDNPNVLPNSTITEYDVDMFIENGYRLESLDMQGRKFRFVKCIFDTPHVQKWEEVIITFKGYEA